MKKNVLKHLMFYCAAFGAVLTTQTEAHAQSSVPVPFTTRTNPGVLNVKGDFAMTGNSNLTVQGGNPNDQSTNSNANMQFIDIDDDTSTINSSSADLVFRTENNANHACTDVVFAGLYWTGRTNSGALSSTASNPQTYSIPGQTFTNQTQYSGTNSNGLNFTIPTGTGGQTRQGLPLYLQSGSTGSRYNMIAYDVNNVRYRLGIRVSGDGAQYILISGGNIGGNDDSDRYITGFTPIPATFSVVGSGNGEGVVATLTNPTTLAPLNNETATIKSFGRTTVTTFSTFFGSNTIANFTSGTGNRYRFQVGYDYVSSPTGTYNLTKTLTKNVIRLKVPGSSTYQTLTASTNNIYYPGTGVNSEIYSAFVDVTNIVNAAGEGTYTVADLAASSGNGESVGFFGGWTLVVVYENFKMEYRDISIFDGHAYINNGNPNFVELPISGFKARQNGPVAVKIGMIAGEGDRSITGDYLEIKQQSNGQFIRLSPDGTPNDNNFFRSRIDLLGASRNPSYNNNTGLDVMVLNLNNTNKNIITNNDSTTAIRFGTTQDTYTLPLFVMAVDAYIPEITPINQITSVNGVPYNAIANDPISPLDTVEYKLVLENTGSETIDSLAIKIPLPLTAKFLSMSHQYIDPNTVGFPVPVFDSTEGVNGTIYWGVIDSFPKPTNPGDTFAVLTYKLVATNECHVLMNPACAPVAAVDGYAVGIGAISRIQIDSLPFIFGIETQGACLGDPIREPQSLVIDGADYVLENCGENQTVVRYTKCTGVSTATVVTPEELAPNFPNGSIYTNGYPNYTQVFTTGLPYPTTTGDTLIYYAIPPEGSLECYFKILVTNFDQPQYVDHDYHCRQAWVQINANFSNSDASIYRVLETYRYGMILDTTVFENNTGYFSSLYGIDSMVFEIENGGCIMDPLGIDFPDCIGPLPVEFKSFTAKKAKNAVQLDWITANERNVAFFTVQHSTNGGDFKDLGRVGLSTSQELLKDYQYLHKNPSQGINYYRIQETDEKGNNTYSIIRTIDFNKNFSIEVYPNPATDKLTVRMITKDDHISNYWIGNSVGQQISHPQQPNINPTNAEFTIDVQSYTNGVYFLNITLESGETLSHKFTINK